ncbi:MAG TPA: GNAT family N-acetyltransferase [Gaiellaceae bacterium]|nr:GNAT family N-acetyltransferase [Gaiellaceae bacterium]
MGEPSKTVTIRRLGPGDEHVVRRLADREPQTALLADDRTVFAAAFAGEEPVGFAFGYVLPRRHGRPEMFFVYELEVDEGYRRRGIGKRLMEELLAGHDEAFVLTEPDNDAANALYASLGGTRVETVMWDFELPTSRA